MTGTLDRKTIFHCIRTSLYAVRIALSIEREDLKVRNVWLAALFHDIGKAKIPKQILNKAGKLTAEEMLVMKTHARKGAEILGSRLPAAITDAILYHHENIDGTGYYGLGSKDIPEAAKVIRICDVYDSLISKRAYKEPWSKVEALNYLKSIVWPEPTHSKDGHGGLLPWEPIWKYLDFSDLGRSIFGRKKSLAEKTMNRIARGLEKFVFNNPEPFIVQVNHGGDNFRGQSIHEPLPTVTSKHDYGIVSPVMMPFIDKSYGGNYVGAGSSVDEPIHTVTTVDHNRLVTPIMIQYHSETSKNGVRGQQVTDPVQTIDTSNRYGLVSAFLTKFYKTGCGQSLAEPIHTITTSPGHFGIVSVFAVDYQDLKKAGIDDETAQECTWVSQFIMEYYGCGTGQRITDPLHMIVTKERFALITILGNKYALLDICLRMLTPEELKLGQGFPKDYIIDRDYKWKPYPITKQVARIGNSVVPIMAKILVDANCPYLKVGERIPNLRIEEEQTGQIRFA